VCIVGVAAIGLLWSYRLRRKYGRDIDDTDPDPAELAVA
jgi:hypothetical protein